MATLEELEARLVTLEARAGPVVTPLATPPITLGELTDVPTPGAPIASTWAQEVTGRIRHRFTNAAARDSQWPAATAGAGAMCITLNDNMTWTSNGTAWIVMPGTVLNNSAITAVVPIIGGGAGTTDVATVSFAAAVPCTVTVNVVGWYGGPSGGTGFAVAFDLLRLSDNASIAAVSNLTPDATWKAAPFSGSYFSGAGPNAGFKTRITKGNGATGVTMYAAYLVTAT